MSECVILAGGVASRLGTQAGDLPKTLLPVAGRPFADHQLTWLAEQGVTQVVYCIGYRGDQIRDYVGAASAGACRSRTSTRARISAAPAELCGSP